MHRHLSADNTAAIQAHIAAKPKRRAQRPFHRLPDLDPKARGCVAAIAMLTLAACGGSDDPVKPDMTIDLVDCSASGVCR